MFKLDIPTLQSVREVAGRLYADPAIPYCRKFFRQTARMPSFQVLNTPRENGALFLRMHYDWRRVLVAVLFERV